MPNRVEITSFNGWTHPQWSPNDLANDIALIELPSPITFNDYIKPSCLPSVGDTADPNELVTATGWGKPSDNAGGISPVLRMVEDLPIITNSECNAIYGMPAMVMPKLDLQIGKEILFLAKKVDVKGILQFVLSSSFSSQSRFRFQLKKSLAD